MSCPPPTPHVYDCLRHRKDSDQAKRLLPPLDLPDKHRAGAGGGCQGPGTVGRVMGESTRAERQNRRWASKY